MPPQLTPLWGCVPTGTGYALVTMSRREATGIALGLWLVLAVVYARPLFLGDTFVLRDHLTLAIPSRTYLAEALARGRLPEWCDALGLGMPFLANPLHQVLYPPAWLFALLPMPAGLDLWLVLHLFAAGLGTAALSRRLGAGPLGAWLAGAILSTSGYATSMIVMGVPATALAWTPWVAWASDRIGAARSGRARAREGLLLAALLAGQILAGDPGAIVTAGLVAVGVVVSRGGPGRLGALAALAGAAVAAVLLAAVLVVPALGLLGESTRSGGLDAKEGLLWSMHPLRLFEWIFPHALGNPTEPVRHLSRVLADTGGDAGLEPSWALGVFLGAPVLLCAGVAAVRRRPLLGLLVTVAVLVVFALGEFTPVYPAYRALMLPERAIRYPERHLAGAIVLLAALAGVGFRVSFGARRAKAEPPPSRRLVLAAGAGTALVGAGALVVALLLRDGAGPRAARAAAESVDVALALADVRRGALGAFGACLLFWGAVGVAARGRTAAAEGGRRADSSLLARAAAPLAAAAILLPLIGHAWSLLPLVDRAVVARPPALIASVLPPANAPYRPRVYRPRTLPTPRGLSASDFGVVTHETALENVPLRFGFADFPGYDPAHGRRFADFWTRAAAIPAERILDTYDVEYAILPAHLARAIGLPVVVSGSFGFVLVHNEERRPRAYVEPGRAPCSIHRHAPEKVELTCRVPDGAPGRIVWLEGFFPGWSAQVDGRPVPIERAEELVMAVAAPPGEHRVVFTYRTPGLRAGAAISAFTWAAWLAFALWLRRGSTDKGPPAQILPQTKNAPDTSAA